MSSVAKSGQACQKVDTKWDGLWMESEKVTSYVNGMVDVLNSLRNGRRIGDKSWAKVMQ
jgi:hypothetical protein